MSAVLEDSAVEIRPMQESDIDAVVAVETRSYDFPWSATIFNDCLRVGYCCWVMQGRECLQGYAIMSVAAEESHVLNVCIDGTYRRRGYARAMLDHMVATASSHGARVCFLEVRPSNTGAITLYKDYGFRHVGTRRDYYPARHGREDAYVLSLSLPLKATNG